MKTYVETIIVVPVNQIKTQLEYKPTTTTT